MKHILVASSMIAAALTMLPSIADARPGGFRGGGGGFSGGGFRGGRTGLAGGGFRSGVGGFKGAGYRGGFAHGRGYGRGGYGGGGFGYGALGLGLGVGTGLALGGLSSGYGGYGGGYYGGAGYGNGYAPAGYGGPLEETESVETEAAPTVDQVGYCVQRFRSYDRRSGTYLGNDGQRHSCP